MKQYFVGCDTESPERIYFNMTDAVNGDHEYIEVFDENGFKLIAYKREWLVDGESYYTSSF